MKDNKKIITMTLLIIGIILIVGTSYAFFVYVRESSKNSQLIAGEIYMNYLDGTQTIGLSNAFPETYDEAMERDDNIFTFQVKGKNTSTKDLYYKIVLTYGDNVSGKTRIKDEDVKIYLERNGVKVIDGESFDSINNKTILVETFDANTLQEQTIDYTLRIWFSEDIIISDTAPYASYTTSEWKDIFASVKIKVEGQAGNNTFVKPLVNEINTKYASYLTDADAFGNRYISGTSSQITNNYVKFSGKLWRIVGINSDGTIKLITESAVDARAWDENGNTDYATSTIRTWLNNQFLQTLDQDLIATTTFNYTGLSGNMEVGEIKMLQDKVGLISLFDYMGAIGADLSTFELGLIADNYLMNGVNYWSTANDKEGVAWYITGKAYAFSGIGDISVAQGMAEVSLGVRPVINLVSSAKIVEGDGTKNNPYVIKGAERFGAYDYNDDLETELTNLQSPDLNGNRYVVGEVEDNYLWYSGKLWRIVSLNGDGTVKLVTQNNITSIAWDINNSNNYSTSQVRRWLNNEFIKTLHNNGELVEKSEWDYGYGIATDKVGMLTINDYWLASGGPVTDSYLKIGYIWWTMTPYIKNSNSSSVWFVNEEFFVDAVDYTTSASDAFGVRPSINLKSGIRISGGDGSVSNPYRIEGDKETGVSNELLNNRISGEYVKFNGVKYRIVGIENINNQKLTKITMADYDVNNNTIDTEEVFGNGGVFTDNAGIGLYLKNWYEGSSVDETSRGMIATKEDGVLWYQGPVTDGDYTKSKTGTGISATIGLPYYGEMFSTQFGEGSDDSVYTWFMTRGSGANVWRVNIDGRAHPEDATLAHGVRPSMYLKSNVKIADTNGDGNVGNGTLGSPYELVLG